MSEGREGRNLKRREAMKKWRAVLAVFLSVVLVLQSSNIQALADVIDGDGETGREEIVLDKPAETTETSESTDEQKNTPPASEPKKEEPAEPAERATPEEPAEKKDDSTKKDEPTQTTEPVEKAEETKPAEETEPAQTTEPSKETSSSTADKTSSPETEAPAETPAEETDTTVTLNVEVSAATLKYSAQDGTEKSVTSETDPKSVDVSNTLDFTFTVAPDDGQQVSSVAYAGTELSANDSGEYTIAAADLTDGEEIVVTTEAVPTEEPAEDGTPVEPEETTEPTEDETTTTEDAAKAEEVANGVIDAIDSVASSLLVSRVAPSSIQVTQKIVGNDEYSKTVSLDLSSLPLTLDTNVAQPPELPDGNSYEFVYARVGQTNVASINYDAATDQLYLGIEGNSLSGILIDVEDSSQIVLWYEPHVDEYGVTYVIKCDGEPVDDVSSVGSLVGRDSIKEGETLQFTFAPNEGYEIANVTATNGNVSGESGAYSLSSVTEETTVTIELTEKTTYNFTFHESSNTDFKGTNATGGTVEFSSSQGGSFTYLRGDSISFTLKANMQNDGNSKALNKVTLSIGSYQNMALNIPTGSNLQVEASETTPLANGMVATVKLIDLGHWVEDGLPGTWDDKEYNLPTFEVTISKGSYDAVRGDITLSTNFKDAETQEVWAKDLVGTELTIAVHNGKTWPFDSYEYKTLDPSKFEFATIHKDDTYVYVHVLPGFDANDVNLTVYVDGVADDSYELKELTQWTDTPGADNAWGDGCQYYIVIPESENGKDIRVSVVATSEERQFAAAFEGYDGAPGTLSATYSVGDSISVDDGRDVYPTQEGKVFQGWKIENDASGTVYLPGDPFTITSDNQDLAKLDDHGRYVYTFVPVWADADEAASAPYEVNVYFEQDDGYPETPDVAFSENGPYGQIAFLIEEKLNEQLATEDGLPENWQEGYEIDVEKSGNLQVEVTGNSSINIYYKKKANDVTYEFVSGTDGESLPQAILDMEPQDTTAKYKDPVTAAQPEQTTYHEQGRGTWTFQGWSSSDVELGEGDTFTMPAKDVELTGEWTLEIDGVYGVNDLTYTFESGTDGESLPQAILDMEPQDTTAKYKDPVTAAQPEQTTYHEQGRGTWTFQGWSSSDVELGEGDTFTMPAKDVELTGEWTLEIDGVYGVNDLTYTFESGTDGESLPQAILDMEPQDTTAKYKDPVTAAQPEQTTYHEQGRGTWTFQGWSSSDVSSARATPSPCPPRTSS